MEVPVENDLVLGIQQHNLLIGGTEKTADFPYLDRDRNLRAVHIHNRPVVRILRAQGRSLNA